MPGPSTSPLYTALAFHRARTNHDLDRAMTHVMRDIVCHTPMGPVNGAAEVRAFMASLSRLGHRPQDRIHGRYHEKCARTRQFGNSQGRASRRGRQDRHGGATSGRT
jgi:hypothetical protein